MAARLNSSLMTVCYLVGHPRRICKRSLFSYVSPPFLTLLLSTNDSISQAALKPPLSRLHLFPDPRGQVSRLSMNPFIHLGPANFNKTRSEELRWITSSIFDYSLPRTSSRMSHSPPSVSHFWSSKSMGRHSHMGSTNLDNFCNWAT